MTPEALDYLAKAREDLADAQDPRHRSRQGGVARGVLRSVPRRRGDDRGAHRRGGSKPHTGVRTALAKLFKDAPAEDRDWLAFLGRAYKYKELSDDGVGRAAVLIEAEAGELLADAARFVDRIEVLLAPS